MITTKKEIITIVDDIKVVVPLSNNLMTPFILKEQGDWFENEIKFVRILIEPGMNIIDIGANYGLYTLSCAKKMQNKGHLWAFEPTRFVADCLQDSIRINNFSNVSVIQKALSNKSGDAKLWVNSNSELNSMNRNDHVSSKFEEIDVVTLDSCKVRHKWNRIDFIKLDAEGEEVRILEGGKETLKSLSPIIMYELKHGAKVNIDLIKTFESYGYPSYFLMPGPMVLMPFIHNIPIDPFQLNLFSMKDDMARILSQKGLLSLKTNLNECVDIKSITDNLWYLTLKKYPFAKAFLEGWQKYVEDNITNGDIRDYIRGLNYLAHSLNENTTPTEKLAYLLSCERILEQIPIIEKSLSMIITYIRILFALNKRAEALAFLKQTIRAFTSGHQLTIELPFFPVDCRYDAIDTKGNPSKWLLSSLIESYEKNKGFSSYFAGKGSLQNLQYLSKLGYCSDEIDRRIELLQSL